MVGKKIIDPYMENILKLYFDGKTILVTGGTGSFGNALVNTLLDSSIKEIRIFSRDEKKQDDMRNKYQSEKLKFYIGDVRDFASINEAMHGVDLVFSAAALKQVPSSEFFPIEFVKTNILGTANVIDSAIKNNVKSLVCLSTDKAVMPVNSMGMSKALMEKTMMAKARNLKKEETVLCGTRYGNIMGSRGSVIPLFIQQIKENKDITITNPIMTRFMMNLSDAIALVFFAFGNASQGDLFIKKVSASTILTLAEVFNRYFFCKE